MPTWTLRDSTTLVDMYEKYHDVIVGGFSANPVPRSRQASWQALYEEFNSVGPDNLREVVHIQTKISNVKDEARKYAKAVRSHETEDGPSPPEPPFYVKKMFDIVQRQSGDSFNSLSLIPGPETTMSSGDMYSSDAEEKRIKVSETYSECDKSIFSAFPLDDVKPPLTHELQADDNCQSKLVNEQRKLVKEKRYLIYLKTLKVCSELLTRGVPFESFESFSRANDNGENG